MKKECLICGQKFNGRADVKCCPDCRAEGKRICSQCGRVYIDPHKVSMCSTCKNKRTRQREREKRERMKEVCDRNPQHLADMAQAAREMGLSYGQYSAMRRGLLRV